MPTSYYRFRLAAIILRARRFFPSSLALAALIVSIAACRSTNDPKGPSWAKARVLADNEDHPSKIVSDGTTVYFVTGGTVASKNEGTNNIKSISLSDGRVSVFVRGGESIPNSMLAVDQQYVYWSDGGNIFRVPKAGGSSENIVANAPQPDELLLDNDNFYWLIWTGEGSPPAPIMYAPKNGGEPKQLTPPQPPTSGIVLDGDVIYWMIGDGIKRIPKSGGVITDFYRHAFKQPSLGLQHDAENFYFCQMDESGHSALMKLNKKSGELTQLAPSINHTMEFVVADGNVYYFDDVPKTGSFGPVALRRVTTGGGSPVEIDQGNAGWIKHLAVDSKQVYFTDISRVYALPK